MINKIYVYANDIKVGTIALTKDNRIAFQYSDEQLEKGFSINPFKLPLSKELFFASTQYFRGLFGVFADSLPDSFGELLLDRYLKSKNININECNEPLNSKEVQDIDTLFFLGGSIGGARPKSLIKYTGDDYIVKFSAKFDPKNIAELEYKYMSLAKEVGINIPQIKLITSKKGNKYFLIKTNQHKFYFIY